MQEQPYTTHGGVRNATEKVAWSSLVSKLAAGGAMKLPTSSACSPKLHPHAREARARSSRRILLSKQPPCSAALVPRWSALCTHAAATSFAASLLFEELSPHHDHEEDLPPLGHFLSPPCRQLPPSRGRKVWNCTSPTTSTGQYKRSLCLEAAQYNSSVSMDLLRLKRSERKTKNVFHI